jgi:hypothetical protein
MLLWKTTIRWQRLHRSKPLTTQELHKCTYHAWIKCTPVENNLFEKTWSKHCRIITIWHKYLQHNWYTLTCLNRFRWMTRISGNDHSPSFFTTSCLRLQFGQCHASSAPNTSARVYSWSDKRFMCAMNMKYYWYQYTKQQKGWEQHYSQEHAACIFWANEFGSQGCSIDLEKKLHCSHTKAARIWANQSSGTETMAQTLYQARRH